MPDRDYRDADANSDAVDLVRAAITTLIVARNMISNVYPLHHRIGAALDALDAAPDSWPDAPNSTEGGA